MNLIECIRKRNYYSGDKPTRDKVSVSEISGSDVMQMVLKRKFVIEPVNKINQATLGSIFDAGMRDLLKRYNEEFGTAFTSGVRVEKTLPNGIIISGEMDTVNENPKEIYDTKLSKIYALEMWLKTESSHQYTLQQNFYNWLLGGGYAMFLLWGLKDQSDMKSDKYSEAMILMPVEKVSIDFLMGLAVTKSDMMIAILDEKEPMPSKCIDTWRNNSRCEHYCDCNKVCPYYNSF